MRLCERERDIIGRDEKRKMFNVTDFIDKLTGAINAVVYSLIETRHFVDHSRLYPSGHLGHVTVAISGIRQRLIGGTGTFALSRLEMRLVIHRGS